mmetsp:Transcript_84911/g.214208  ORF Transcript_84911/g.214208 Transcript_84911/m.214208 type:complete len:291 (+) Transcript_84911:166-1038(+)
MYGNKSAHALSGMLGHAKTQAQEALRELEDDKMAHDLSGKLGHAQRQAQDAFSKHGGQGLLDRMKGMSGHAQKTASHGVHWMEQHVPGAAFLIEEAEAMWHSDVPGGFQLGHIVDITVSTVPGVRGFVMQSAPDGAEYFIAEDFGCFDCCCLWMGKGPTYHIIEGNPMHGNEVLMLQSHRPCCCVSPELDVMSPDGEVIAKAVEHSYCCCFANTRVHVRGSEAYRLTGNIFGAVCSCFNSEHRVVDNEGKRVGRIVHWNEGAHLQLPKDGMASQKAGLLAATLLTDLRRR